MGYLARNHPEWLETGMMDEPEDTLRDGYWLVHRCREANIEPVKVSAPKFLQEKGIAEVNAYPIYLLKRRFED